MKIKAFHGTPHKFTSFDMAHVGATTGTAGGGFGLYFTTSEDEAAQYGANIHTVTLSLGRGLAVGFRTLSRSEVSEILEAFEAVAENSYVENWGDFGDALDALDGIDNDSEILGDIINATGEMMALFEVLGKMGITHASDCGFLTDERGEVSRYYIIYDLAIINK